MRDFNYNKKEKKKVKRKPRINHNQIIDKCIDELWKIRNKAKDLKLGYDWAIANQTLKDLKMMINQNIKEKDEWN